MSSGEVKPMLKSKKVEKPKEGEKATEFDAYTFQDAVKVGENLINFYVPWIQESLDFEAIWDQLVEKYKDI
jgi:hypothetical protein